MVMLSKKEIQTIRKYASIKSILPQCWKKEMLKMLHLRYKMELEAFPDVYSLLVKNRIH